MVGLFSRFYVGRNGHRRTQSAVAEVLPSNPEGSNSAAVPANLAPASVISHGVEVATEFKPVEHPDEPLDTDQPVQCPLPERSILNDGKILKDHVSASMRARADISVLKEGTSSESEASETKAHPVRTKRLMLPSLSAPEQNILNLLEECDSSRI